LGGRGGEAGGGKDGRWGEGGVRWGVVGERGVEAIRRFEGFRGEKVWVKLAMIGREGLWDGYGEVME